MEIIDLPDLILNKIINLIDTTEDYNNLRLVNNKFHKLMNINKRFEDGLPIEIYTFFQNNIFNENIIWHKQGPIKQIKNFNHLGLRDNLQLEYYKNKKIKTLENYSQGCKNGIHKDFYLTGILKKISIYKHGYKFGKEYINNQEGNLKFLKTHINKHCYEIERYTNNLMISKCNIKNSKIFGTAFYYQFNGDIKKKCNYINGSLEGKTYIYNDFGLYKLINYKNNKKNGFYMLYNNLGEIHIYCNFKNDTLNGPLKIFNINSKNIYTMNFKNGLLDGEYIYYDIIKKKYNFKNNMLHGYYIDYYNNNNPKYKIKFCNNRFDKIYKKYNFNGSLNIEILITDNGYKIIKYKNDIEVLTIHKIENEYYYSKDNQLIYLDSFYFNPIFHTSEV